MFEFLRRALGRPVNVEVVGLEGSEILFLTDSPIQIGRLEVNADLAGLVIRGRIQVVEATTSPFHALWLEPIEVLEHIQELFAPSEKRKDPRCAVDFKLDCKAHAELDGTTRDLSVSGLRADFAKRFFPGDKLALAFRTNEAGSERLKVTVIVRWSAPSHEEGRVICGLALATHEDHEEEHQRYRSFVQSLLD